jgi:hypothetical protein
MGGDSCFTRLIRQFRPARAADDDTKNRQAEVKTIEQTKWFTPGIFNIFYFQNQYYGGEGEKSW